MVKKLKDREKEINESDELPFDAPQRWCSTCREYVKVKGKKKNVCVKCGSFTAKHRPEEKSDEEEAQEEEKGKVFKMSSLRPVNLSGGEMATSEMLINAGFAKNFNDLVRKSIDLFYREARTPGLQSFNPQMEKLNKTEPDPEKAMKQIQEQEIMSSYAKKLRGDSEASPQKTMAELQNQRLIDSFIKNMNKGEQQDPLQFMMLMRMMENTGAGKDHKDNNFMDKMMQLQMIRSMGGGENQNVVALQKELADMKMMQQFQQMQKAPTLQDQMMALEKIRADRDIRVREAELDAQSQRDLTLKIAMDSKLKDLERSIDEARQAGGALGVQRIRELKEEISAIKEMSHELGEREKGAGEYISETITNVATQLQPTFTSYMEQKRQQQAMQPPQQVPQEFQKPQQPPQEFLNPELTPSEQEMANTLNEMYIKERK